MPSDEVMTSREPKHSQIASAIVALRRSVNALDSLMGDVSGRVDPPREAASPKTAEREVPALITVLSDSPTLIREQADRVEELTKQLNELLF